MKFRPRKAAKCKHDNVTNYHYSGGCGTPYCGGWSEYHCRDCGAYFAECACGSCNGFSGWPYRRWLSFRRA